MNSLLLSLQAVILLVGSFFKKMYCYYKTVGSSLSSLKLDHKAHLIYELYSLIYGGTYSYT
jgi:hypothetical protein